MPAGASVGVSRSLPFPLLPVQYQNAVLTLCAQEAAAAGGGGGGGAGEGAARLRSKLGRCSRRRRGGGGGGARGGRRLPRALQGAPFKVWMMKAVPVSYLCQQLTEVRQRALSSSHLDGVPRSAGTAGARHRRSWAPAGLLLGADSTSVPRAPPCWKCWARRLVKSCFRWIQPSQPAPLLPRSCPIDAAATAALVCRSLCCAPRTQVALVQLWVRSGARPGASAAERRRRRSCWQWR